MTGSDTYLKAQYRLDTDALQKVRTVVRETANVLESFFDQELNRWPYEVSVSGEWKASAESYSFSTNSMIAFALAAACGLEQPGVLIPMQRQSAPVVDVKEHPQFRHILLRALQALIGQSNGKDFVTSSPTYGKDDPFSLTWVLEILRISEEALRLADTDLRGVRSLRERAAAAAAKRLSEVVKAVKERPYGFGDAILKPAKVSHETRTAETHIFPLLRVMHMASATRPAADSATENSEATDRLHDLSILNRVFLDTLHRQLSLSAIDDSTFDVAELVFALEGSLLSGPGPDAAAVDKVFSVIADSQAKNPYWRPLRPFISSNRGFALVPLSVEIASSLLRSCHSLAERGERRPSYFAQHLDLFRRYAQWLEARRVTGSVQRHSQDSGKAPQSAECIATTFVGWHSEHVLTAGTIHLWETSQVMLFLVLYEEMLRRRVAESALEAVNLRANRQDGRKLATPTIAHSGSLTIREQIFRDYVAPRTNHHLSGAPSRDLAHRSMLLYGPPGTGKTSLARQLAVSLGWNLVYISPSDFIAQGPAAVEARAKDIFDALQEQSDVVIMFDEIDRLVLDRDTLMYRAQGDLFQFMTPSMLTKLADLYSRNRAIFVLGTNYFERIDPAIKRPGRFDDAYLVMPPSRRERRDALLASVKTTLRATRIGSSELGPDQVEGVIGALKGSDSLEEVVKQTVFSTYKEISRLAEDAVIPSAADQQNSGQSLNELADHICKSLNKLIEDYVPAISIASYASRFKATYVGQEFPTVQEPYDELAALVMMKAEAEVQLDSSELKLLATIFNGDVEGRLERGIKGTATLEEIRRRADELRRESERAAAAPTRS